VAYIVELYNDLTLLWHEMIKSISSSPLIKVCGLTNACDAILAAEGGVSLCGFIFHPSSQRAVSPAAAKALPTPGALRVGVFVQQGLKEILAVMEEANLDLAQLHGPQGREIAKALGPEKVLRVFWPERHDSLKTLEAELAAWAELAALFLFDAGQGGGGHGRKLKLPSGFRSPRPYLLAGGLRVGDVAALWPPADPQLRGFDLNSGLEAAPGVKAPEALKALAELLASGALGQGWAGRTDLKRAGPDLTGPAKPAG
jgi:phosphoribosylanthranilate isomerase